MTTPRGPFPWSNFERPALAATPVGPAPRASYATQISELRTTLGRAGIAVETRGSRPLAIVEAFCDDGVPAHCVRCELAGEDDGVGLPMLDAMTAAFARYPTPALVAAKIRQVALCRRLETASGAVGVADVEHGRMFVHVDVFNAHQLEDIVHHELYHLFDYATQPATYHRDPGWELLNPRGFTYGARRGSVARAGFVNTYAMTNVREDRASVFEYLMAQPDKLCERLVADHILADKAGLLLCRFARATDATFLQARAPCVPHRR